MNLTVHDISRNICNSFEILQGILQNTAEIFIVYTNFGAKGKSNNA